MLRTNPHLNAAPIMRSASLAASDQRADSVWFETRWGFALLIVATLLVGSATLYYLFLTS
jgi:hypothetical protein